MAGNPAFNAIFTTTIQNRSKVLADNVTKNNALLARLNSKGNVKTFDGGTTIVQELDYAENDAFQWYSGYETLNVAPRETFTAAEFAIKQAAVPVVISGLELLKNSGKEKFINLLTSKVKNAERTLENNIAISLYGDGTANGGREIGGLKLLVADDPTTGIVGGIDRSDSDNVFWRNQVFDFSANSLTPGPTTITRAMNRLWLAASRGKDVPDLIVANNTYFEYYEESLQAIQRITKADRATTGFEGYAYKSADVIYDGGVGGGLSSSDDRMYMLNTNYIFLRPHEDRNMVKIGGTREPVNQDAMVEFFGFAGNMSLSNAMLQGVIIA